MSPLTTVITVSCLNACWGYCRHGSCILQNREESSQGYICRQAWVWGHYPDLSIIDAGEPGRDSEVPRRG